MSADVILNKDSSAAAAAVLHPINKHTVRYVTAADRMNGRQMLETQIDSMSSSSLESTRSVSGQHHARKSNDDEALTYCPKECHSFGGQVIFDDIEEDTTVLSAYDPHASDTMDTLTVSGEVVYDDIGEGVYGMDNGTPVLFDEPLDIGYKLARWSESLTTYKAKSKRHSDEILYQNSSGSIQSETKRHSGEVLYDETTSRYHLRSETRNSNQSSMHDDIPENRYSQAKPHRLRMIYSDIDSPPLGHKLKMQKTDNKKSHECSRTLTLDPVSDEEKIRHTVFESVNNYSVNINELKALSDKNSSSEIQRKKIETISGEMTRSNEQTSSEDCSPDGRSGMIIYDDTMDIYESLPPDQNSSNHKVIFDDTKSPEQVNSPSSSTSLIIPNNELQSNPPLSPDKTPLSSPEYCEGTSCIIGNVPIAVYDQSPRRYGPKPGYPTRNVQDIILQDDSISITDSTSTEEEFNELEYKLYHVHTGSQYVGKRLAQSYTTSFSSPKPLDIIEKMGPTIEIEPNSDEGEDPMSSQEHMQDCEQLESGSYLQHEHSERCTISTSNDVEDVIIDPAEAETLEPPRNFSLSPEATECDSVEAESEMSLDNESNLHDIVLPGSGMPILEDGLSSGHGSDTEPDSTTTHSKDNPTLLLMKKQILEIEREIACKLQNKVIKDVDYKEMERLLLNADQSGKNLDYRELEKILFGTDHSRNSSESSDRSMDEDMLQDDKDKKEMVELAIKDIKEAIRQSKSITLKSPAMEVPVEPEPVWVLRYGLLELPLMDSYVTKLQRELRQSKEDNNIEHHEVERKQAEEDTDTDQETDHLLGKHKTDDRSSFYDDKREKRKSRAKEVIIHEPAVLIEGVLFRARYLGSTQLLCEGRPTKASRMMQAQEAVSRIKAPEGESQPSTEVDLFISTEKIMVLNIDLQEIVMDHSLRTISYIADIGDLVVLMARRRILSSPDNPEPQIKKTPKMLCHVFESEEAQFIAQSIGQAFQVAYMEFLKANGIEDHSFVKEMDYQEVLNSQEILGDELEMFSKKDKQKEVVVPKQKGEILGLVIVESGWGSMLPTVVIANMAHNGAAARCGQLNIGDQIIAINGISLVGLPLSTCQNYIKNTKNQTVVKLTVVRCPPVVEVRIKRPDTKYQLGFSVQNGVICSLLRGGIAERGGVRVGHRIIEINGQSVVAVPHERIVNLLASSIGEIHMKTMPTSMYRLLTGQETPIYI